MKNRINIFVRLIAFAIIYTGGICLIIGILYHQGNIVPEKFLTEDLGVITVILLSTGIQLLFLSLNSETPLHKPSNITITIGYCIIIVAITMTHPVVTIGVFAMSCLMFTLVCILLYSWRNEANKSQAKFWSLIDNIGRRMENA